METQYQLSVDAENDLREIISYTLENFGKKQAQNYSNELSLCLNMLLDQKGFQKEFKIKNYKIHMIHGCVN